MDISTLLESPDPLLVTLAEKAQKYKAARAAGKLSEEDYAALSEQITDLRGLTAIADSEDERQRVAEAVQVIAAFLKAVP